LQRGWLRLFTLRLDGNAVASLYGFHYGRVFYFYQSGFNPAYANHSVGLLMMAFAIQSAIEEGAEEYDMLHGTERYKFHWAHASREIAKLELYPPGVVGATWKLVRATSRYSKRLVRNVLPENVVEKVAAIRRNAAGKDSYVAVPSKSERFPCLTLDRRG
jgi:CelD/BcsL family acetyltransferase involved in cellulose biosynthesis